MYNLRMLLNKQSKRMLAECLATEKIKIIYSRKVKTPSFDPIQRKLTLPNWVVSENVENLVIGHEMAHALFSHLTKEEIDFFEKHGFHALGEAVYKDNPHVGWSYYQIIEDFLVEKRMKEKYKGTKKDFSLGYRELMEKNFFGIQKQDEMLLIDKLNVYFKVRYSCSVPVQFTEEERPFVEKCENLNTKEDVLSVAKEVFQFCLNKMKSKQDENKESDDKSDVTSSDSSVGASNNSSSGESSVVNINTPVSQRTFNFNLNSTIDMDDTVKYYDCPSCDFLPIVTYKELLEKSKNKKQLYMERIVEYKKSCETSVNVMIQEFMRKKAAKDYEKSQVFKTGIINTNKLSHYKFSEDIFKKIKEVKKGKSHALILCVDWSSSMKKSISHTMDQLYRIIFFCRKMNIPFEVYLFSGNIMFTDIKPFPKKTRKKTDVDMIPVKMNNFSLFNIFSSKMNNDEFHKMLYEMVRHTLNIENDPIYDMLSTPLDECIVAMNKFIPQYKKDNNVEIMNVIFLSDGDSDPKEWGSTQSNNYIYYDGKSYRIRVNPTNTLLKILKEKTDSNVIGIYLSGQVYDQEKDSYKPRYCRTEQDIDQFRNFGYFCPSADLHGYDNLFVVAESQYDMNRSVIVDFQIKMSGNQKNKYKALEKFVKMKEFQCLMLRKFTECISDSIQ